MNSKAGKEQVDFKSWEEKMNSKAGKERLISKLGRKVEFKSWEGKLN